VCAGSTGDTIERATETEGGGAFSDGSELRAWDTVSEAALCIRDRIARALRRL
jgi:hypothetical protein